ncbi:MAG: hypothetical protein JW779_14165, partial [Candidatus Thorarchaeota archaeon]|nr:hypothetical protein [Candidatus Thorarchaeota archaeon]
MNREINHLFITLDELRKILPASIEKTGEASELAKEISGEFDQEISTDLENIQVKLSELLDDIDSSIGGGRTLKDDEEELEK